jgi:hypothetical protein
MLPLRAFSPRSGRARGFASGGMTLEGDGGQQYWQDAPPPDSSVTVEAAPPEFNNASPVQTGSGQGGGTVDQATLNQLYETYLGRAPDASGSQTWAGQDINSVIAGITGSQEYANRGGGGGGDGGGGGGTDLNALYQQFLGRAPDESGAQTYAGWSTQDVTNAILGSQEYANRSGSTNNTQAPTDVNALYQQYLGRGVDPSGAQTWAGQSPEAIIAGITGSAEYQNLHPGAIPDANTTPEDFSQWIPQVVGTEYHGDAEPTHTYQYIDQKTGNVYDSQSADAKLIASGAAARDTYLSKLNIDAAEKQNLYDLKAKDPNTYYDTVAQKLKDQVYEAYTTNANYDTDLRALDTLSTVAPQAYYKAQLEFLGKQIGWQTGQNTSDRAAPAIEKIKAMAPEAYQAGISEKDINSIVNTAANEANVQNQIRIAREGAEGGGGFNFGKDVMPGVAMIAIAAATVASAGAAAPLGAAILGAEAALAVGATATAALGGAVIGAGMGALTSAAYGGNIEQGAIKGAISGGVGGAASQISIANSLVGSETISSIASATNLSTQQVASIIANTAATTIAAAATGQVNSGNIAQTIGTALASSSIAAYAGNVAQAIDPTMSAAAISAVSNVARIATTATLNGGSVQRAIMNNIPAIISGSVAADMNQQPAKFDPYATENVGLTSGAVDRTLQQGLVDNYINAADDPIAAYNAQRNLTGNPLDNIRYTANVMLDQNMPRQDIVSNLAAVYNVDEKTAENYFQNTVANNAFERLAAKAEDPIALMNAAKMLTGDKQENLKFVADEMKNQGLSKSQISTNLEDLYQIPKDKAEAYANQLLGNKDVVSTANNFADAFKEARGAGAKTFEWNGKQYTTALAPPPAAKTEEEQKTPMQTLAQAMAPRTRTFEDAVNFAKDTASMFDKTTKGLGDRLTDPNRAYPETFKRYSDTTWEKLNSKISPYIDNPEKIIPEIKETIGKAADFYKSSLLATGGQIINSIGDVRNNVAQIAISQGWISPENSFVISSQAMQKFGDTMVPQEFKTAQADIYKSIDSAEGIPGKIVAGLVSSLQHPQAASLYVGDALVQAGLPMAAGAAVTAYTGLVYAGVATASLLQGAQSFGNKYEEVVKDLMNKGMPEVEARDKAMLPAYVAGTITALISPLGNAPIIRAVAGPVGSDVVLRNLTGSVAQNIIEKSMPLFASTSRDFASGFFDNLFGNMSTELIQTGTVNPDKYISGAVLEGLIEVGANSAIKAPFVAADALSAAQQQQQQQKGPQQQDVELKEYKVPLLGYDSGQQNAPNLLPYNPSQEVKAIGYSPVSNDSTVTMVETRDNAAETLSNALGIDLDTATKMATDSIGAAAIDVLNSESSENTPRIDANKVIAEDAFGTPVTYATAIGSITTDTPIIDLEIGTKEQQIENADILKGIFSTLNIDPKSVVPFEPQRQRETVEQTQPTETLFKERPDIRRLFGDTIFGDINLAPTIPETETATDTTAATDTKTDTATLTQPKTQTQTQLQQLNPVAIDTALLDAILPQPVTQTKTLTEPVSPRPIPVDIAVMDPDTRVPRVTVPSENIPGGPKINPPVVVNPPLDINTPTPITITPETPVKPKATAPKLPAIPKATVAKKKKKINPPDLLADFAKGRKIALPLAQLMKLINTQPTNVIPMQNYQNPNPIPFNLEDELKAAKAGGLMRLATGGGSGGSSAGATPGSNISVGPGDASYSPIANFIKGSETKSYLPEKYDLQMFTYAPTPYNAEAALKAILAAAEGGIVHMADGGDTNPAFDPGSSEVKMKGKKFAYHQPFVGLNMMSNAPRFNYGGEVGGHNPQFFSEGGLNAMENRYVTGEGDGTSDSIPAMLANGEFVIPADVVSSLGNGSNDSGASVLDEFLKTIRAHKTRENKNGLPPDSKGALGYLLEAKRKVRA